MAKPGVPSLAGDKEVRDLFDRYRCPVPFHAVRTRFLGNIASPDLDASPIKAVKALWGGDLPPFDSPGSAEELIGVLLGGLWNRLTRHQERGTPFRLIRTEVPATREGLATIARMRREELDGFVAGLFGEAESLDLPERAHQALEALAELRAIVEGTHEVAENPAKPAKPADIAETLGHFREMTRVAEHEMHEAVLSCVRARRQFLAGVKATRPKLH